MNEMENEEERVLCLNVHLSKQNRLVGVAFHTPKKRKLGLQKQKTEPTDQLILYQFHDNSQYSHLDTVIVQTTPTLVLLPMENQQHLQSELKRIKAMLELHHVPYHLCKKMKYVGIDLEKDLVRLIGIESGNTGGEDSNNTTTLAAYNSELEKTVAMEALANLIQYEDLMVQVERFGRYVLLTGEFDNALQLDGTAIWALNLLPDPTISSSGAGSVYKVLNRGKTAMGNRLLERWIRLPCLDMTKITERLNLVEILFNDSMLRTELLEECMKGLPDLERLAFLLDKYASYDDNENEKKKKKAIHSIKLIDLVSIYDAAKVVFPRLYRYLSSYDDASSEQENKKLMDSKFVLPLKKCMEDIEGYILLIEEVIDLDTRPQFTINAKHDQKLLQIQDQLQVIQQEIQQEYEAARDHLGLDNIKCEKDKLRGYVFRVPNKKSEATITRNPKYHICGVQASGGILFNTPTLKKLGNKFTELSAEYDKQQQSLILAAIQVATTYVPVLESATLFLSELDVLLGFAHAAAHAGEGYCRPTIVPPPADNMTSNDIAIVQARHPCVELQDGMNFIANDFNFNHSRSRFCVLTGPNMGGKSTYIRQLGTLAVMAQCGSFVPAQSCTIPLFDKLLVRVGAGDSQTRGVSTFMVEMLEAATILNRATPQSLVIIDELGRGTSTAEGFGIAYAISEYLLEKSKCFTMFATHFHELTNLAGSSTTGGNGVINKHVTAHTENNQVTMIYEIGDGPCLESFGINVAEMANFPSEVLEKAKRKAVDLENFEIGLTNTEEESSTNKRVKLTCSDNDTEPLETEKRIAIIEQFVAMPLKDMGDEEVLPAVNKICIPIID